jgi:hypothetical protein
MSSFCHRLAYLCESVGEFEATDLPMDTAYGLSGFTRTSSRPEGRVFFRKVPCKTRKVTSICRVCLMLTLYVLSLDVVQRGKPQVAIPDGS